MDRKRRTLFAVLVATIIVLGVFSSFAINFFGQEDFQIKLPDISGDTEAGPTGDPGGDSDQLIRIEVTPKTVQSVIATLERPRSYYREISLEMWANAETSAITTASVWVDNGWTRSAITAPGGRMQHNLVSEEGHWLWYEGDAKALYFPVEEDISDLIQRIPTYEDVLELPLSRIADAGYEIYSGVDCIYVEVEQEDLNSRERYWISISDGLVLAEELVSGDMVVYRMTAKATVSPAPLDSDFSLPDGTELHLAREGGD